MYCMYIHILFPVKFTALPKAGAGEALARLLSEQRGLVYWFLRYSARDTFSKYFHHW